MPGDQGRFEAGTARIIGLWKSAEDHTLVSGARHILADGRPEMGEAHPHAIGPKRQMLRPEGPEPGRTTSRYASASPSRSRWWCRDGKLRWRNCLPNVALGVLETRPRARDLVESATTQDSLAVGGPPLRRGTRTHQVSCRFRAAAIGVSPHTQLCSRRGGRALPPHRVGEPLS